MSENNLEIKKLELSKKRVKLGIDELEFKIEERLEDIKRIEDNIEISKNKLDELDAQLKQLKGE